MAETTEAAHSITAVSTQTTEALGGADDTPVESPQEASPAPEATASQVQPKAAVLAPAPSPPEVRVEEPPAEEESKPPAENGVSGETEQTEKPRPKQMANGIQLEYKEGQWSPLNPEGKKQYDREFLLKLQFSPASRKIPSLLDMRPAIFTDPTDMKLEDLQKALALAASRGVPDFTPGFFKSTAQSSVPKCKRRQGVAGGLRVQGRQPNPVAYLHTSRKAAHTPAFHGSSTADRETQEILWIFERILNKLTPDNFERSAYDVLQLNINTEERVCGVTNLLFEKAIAKSKCAALYAHLSKEMLKLPKVPKTSNPNESKPSDFLTFRAVLLTKCQKEFETDTIAEGELEKRHKALEIAPEKEKAQLLEELQKATRRVHRRSLGNTRLIGELFNVKLLTDSIMHDCIYNLLTICDEDSIECSVVLLETTGKNLDTDRPKAKERMDEYFTQLEKLTADLNSSGDVVESTGSDVQGGSCDGQQAEPSKVTDKLSMRVKRKVRSLIQKRKNDWKIPDDPGSRQ